VRWEPWVLSASGVVAVAIGGAFLYRNARDLRALEARLAMRENGLIGNIHVEDAKREEDRIEAWRFGSGAIVGVGIAAVVAGLSWWWFEW
jgi:hypothetical protein